MQRKFPLKPNTREDEFDLICKPIILINFSKFVCKQTHMFLSIFNIILFLVFTVFAYLNLNDKDSWLWVSIYMIAGILCFITVFGLYYPIISLIIVAFYLTYALLLFFSKNGVWDWLTKYKKESLVQSMQATKPYIEKTREFFGLLIASAAVLMNYFIIS